MEALIIEVDCKKYNRDGPPQLGITVEAPYSIAVQQRQQQAKEHRNHDYQNFQVPNNNPKSNSNFNHQNGIVNSILSSSNHLHSKNHLGTLGEPIQRGLQITHIQEGSVIGKIGQFKIGDIIVEVNGVNLQSRTFQDAQKTLRDFVVKQSSHSPLQLKVLRRSASSSSLPSTTGSQATVIERNNNYHNLSSTTTSPKKSSFDSVSTPSPQSSGSARHFVGALNTRRLGTKHHIKLVKSEDGGFGIKIAERDNMFGVKRPIYITAITTVGSAYRDGRLKEGDMLLEVNSIDLSGISQPEITKMLKSVAVGETVEFVISRQEDLPQSSLNNSDLDYVNLDENHYKRSVESKEKDKSLIDLDAPDQGNQVPMTKNDQLEKKIDNILNKSKIDGPGTYVYDIPINDTKSAGLGLYLKYPTLEKRDLGIWIEKVITGGAAWKDGRLLPDDQILAINGINLMNYSNAEASETLTAAVCREIGPEATSNTIRLNILRREPTVVAKILHGTNNRIEYSDIPVNGINKSYIIGTNRAMNNSQDSYQTALERTIHSRSQSSSDASVSNKSSNQNSHNDSAMSPQTQASNSLKFTNSCDRSDHNGSEKTNDTSSAISQITDFTTVPINENVSLEREFDKKTNTAACTLPKTLELSDGIQSADPASSLQSWDDESLDTATGEERFQRDGFGRQSISEKRHAQLTAKNTDTFRRNQKLREEREREQQIREQLERQHVGDKLIYQGYNRNQDKYSSYLSNNPTVPNVDHAQGYDGNSFMSYAPTNNLHREVPVDVDPRIQIETFNRNNKNDRNDMNFGGNDSRTKIVNHNIPSKIEPTNSMNLQNSQTCWRCGSVGSCICRMLQNNQASYSQAGLCYDNHALKRSNSLESLQPLNQRREGLVATRAGTVRVARNRKVNESFRAAVDRSYESSMNDSPQFDYNRNEQRRSIASGKVINSVENSTTSTSNDEKLLINGINGNASNHKKTSSLLTRFLKFGSMKKSKKKNKDTKTISNKTSKELSTSDSETRSQLSKSSHSRQPCEQTNHQKPGYYVQYQQVNPNMKSERIDSQLYGQNKEVLQFRQPRMNPNNHNRDSMHMYQQYHQPMQDMQISNHISHQPVSHPEIVHNNHASRPSSMLHNPQYSQLSLHQQSATLQNHTIHQHIPVDIHNQPTEYRTPTRLPPNSHIGLPNGCHFQNQWQQQAVHAPNGLWVASPPIQANHNHNNLYGTHNQNIAIQHNTQPPVTMSQATPFIPPPNGHNLNGAFHQPMLHGHTQSMTQHHIHNQQPQHIYYYDF